MEYANFPIMDNLFNRLQSLSWVDYWEKVRSLRTDENGVFSYKMFTNNFLNIGREHRSILAQLTPSYVVYLTRENSIEQAISYYRARSSKSWFEGIPPKEDVVYDADEITSCLKLIDAQKKSWEEIFSLTGVHVHRVTYEKFLCNKKKIMRNIVEFIDEPFYEDKVIDIPDIQIQRDEITKEWGERYRMECEASDIHRAVADVSLGHDFICK